MEQPVPDRPERSSAPKQRASTMQQLAPYMGMGIQLAASMCAFGALGWWLDTRFGTTPWLLAAGAILGAAGGMIMVIRTAVASGRKKV